MDYDLVPIQAKLYTECNIRVNKYYLDVNYPNRRFPVDFVIDIDNIYFEKEDENLEFFNVETDLINDDYLEVIPSGYGALRLKNGYIIDIGLTIRTSIPKELYKDFLELNKEDQEGIDFELTVSTRGPNSVHLPNDAFEVARQSSVHLSNIVNLNDENQVSNMEDEEKEEGEVHESSSDDEDESSSSDESL